MVCPVIAINNDWYSVRKLAIKTTRVGSSLAERHHSFDCCLVGSSLFFMIFSKASLSCCVDTPQANILQRFLHFFVFRHSGRSLSAREPESLTLGCIPLSSAATGTERPGGVSCFVWICFVHA